MLTGVRYHIAASQARRRSDTVVAMWDVSGAQSSRWAQSAADVVGDARREGRGDQGSITVTSDNPDIGEELEAEYNSEPLASGFNPKYMLELLMQMTSDQICRSSRSSSIPARRASRPADPMRPRPTSP
jgi:hypothetical protein